MVTEMSQQQLQATMQNQDLRKKLRVDRIRKMAMANTDSRGAMSSASKSVVEDAKEPEWKKHKELKDIDMIRQTKKEMIIQ